MNSISIEMTHRFPRKKTVAFSSMSVNFESLYPQPFHFSSFSRSRGITLTISLAVPNLVVFAAFSRLSYAIASFVLLLLMVESQVSHYVTRSFVPLLKLNRSLFLCLASPRNVCDDSSPMCLRWVCCLR